MERGHGLKDGDERGERDHHSDQNVHEHRRGGRVGPLEQVVQVQPPGGGDGGRPARRVLVIEFAVGVQVTCYCG